MIPSGDVLDIEPTELWAAALPSHDLHELSGSIKELRRLLCRILEISFARQGPCCVALAATACIAELTMAIPVAPPRIAWMKPAGFRSPPV